MLPVLAMCGPTAIGIAARAAGLGLAAHGAVRLMRVRLGSLADGTRIAAAIDSSVVTGANGYDAPKQYSVFSVRT